MTITNPKRQGRGVLSGLHLPLMRFAICSGGLHHPLGLFASSARVVCIFRLGLFACSAWGGLHLPLGWFASSAWGIPTTPGHTDCHPCTNPLLGDTQKMPLAVSSPLLSPPSQVQKGLKTEVRTWLAQRLEAMGSQGFWVAGSANAHEMNAV